MRKHGLYRKRVDSWRGPSRVPEGIGDPLPSLEPDADGAATHIPSVSVENLPARRTQAHGCSDPDRGPAVWFGRLVLLHRYGYRGSMDRSGSVSRQVSVDSWSDTELCPGGRLHYSRSG